MRLIEWFKIEGNARAASIFLAIGGAIVAGAGWLWLNVVALQFPELAPTAFGDGYRLGARITALESQVLALEIEKSTLQIMLSNSRMTPHQQREETKRRLKDGTF